MRKRMFMLFTLLYAAAIACACSLNALPEGFEEKSVLAKAQSVVHLLINEDYESVAGTFSAQMSARLDARALKNALGDSVKRLGAFKEYISMAATGSSDAEIGDFAVAVLVCAYEGGTATYTISIDSDGKVCGLYMK